MIRPRRLPQLFNTQCFSTSVSSGLRIRCIRSRQTEQQFTAKLHPTTCSRAVTTSTITKGVRSKTSNQNNFHVQTTPVNTPREFPEKPRLGDGPIQVYSPFSEKYITVPPVWLRDNCQCNTCVHEVTKQRLLDTFQIPRDISIKSCAPKDDGVEVTWNDDHKSFYKNSFLNLGARIPSHGGATRQAHTPIHLWGSSIAQNPPTLQYQPTPSTQWLKTLLRQIRASGFCYIDNTPTTPSATQALLERISFIRPTHYGGFYDFTANLASHDTAYTSLALPAHTDNTYFSDPAGLQAFHMLSHTDGSGGASLLVDGFKVAQDLKTEDPDAYNILSTTKIHAHASGNEGISIMPYTGFPVLHHDASTGALLQVRWNSSDRASIEMPLERVTEWYDAARTWEGMLRREENAYWEQLVPGRVLIFDNWRVLHGRSEFTGKRRICGGYINRDDWISRFKMLEFGEEVVFGRLAVE